MTSRLALGLLGALCGAGCAGAPAGGTPNTCQGDECAGAGSRAELEAALVGFADPVAAALRAGAGADGTLAGDYRSLLAAVGDQLGCDASSERRFVVLSNDAYVPKTVVTRCAGDPQAASRFFLAIPAVGPDGDVEPRLLHLAAWDPEAARYRRYSTYPAEGGGMTVSVEPGFCLSCHGGPERLDRWVPLMNELTNPWGHWNAEPGFASLLFHEHLDPVVAAGPVFAAVTDPAHLDSAANLEPVVRAGLDRVTAARLRARTDAPDLDAALALLRPLYCDESYNFVSEVHASGELRSAAWVDDALRALFLAARPGGGPWAWLAETRVRLPVPAAGEAALTLIPVRGEATVQAELALVSRQVLDPIQALRVRALDWTHPVASELRCDLYRRGQARLAGPAGAALVAALPDAADNAALVRLVYDELMHLEHDGRLVPLAPTAADRVRELPDAGDPAALAELAAGGREVGLDALGALIEAHLAGAALPDARDRLAGERTRRACKVVERYLPAPLYADLSCP